MSVDSEHPVSSENILGRQVRIFWCLAGATLLTLPFLWNWRTQVEWEQAKAEWNALPYPLLKFGQNVPAEPAVPDERNLLKAPFFEYWARMSGASLDARLEKWSQIVLTYQPKSGPGFAASRLDELFAPGPKTHPSPPALKEVPGESHAKTLLNLLEQDFPELKTLPATRAQRPELSRGRPELRLEALFSSPEASFRHIRDSYKILATYAGLRALDGDGVTAHAAVLAALDFGEYLQKSPTEVDAAIVAVQTKRLPVPVTHAALTARCWTEEQLRTMQHRLIKMRNVPSVRKNCAQDSIGICCQVEKRGAPGLFIPNETLDALIPHGFYRAGLTIMTRRSQRLFLESGGVSAHLEVAGLSTLNPKEEWWHEYHPTYRLVNQATPDFRKVLLNAAHADIYLDCAGLGCALERHRLRHGTFPKTLAELDPAVLAKVPSDPLWSAEPEYRLNPDGGYTLTFKNTDCADCAPGTERTTGKDVVWTIPGFTAF